MQVGRPRSRASFQARDRRDAAAVSTLTRTSQNTASSFDPARVRPSKVRTCLHRDLCAQPVTTPTFDVTTRGGKKEPQTQGEVMSSLGVLRQFVYKLGPYLMLEALLPGGTVLALLLFLYRGRKLNSGDDARGPALGVNGRDRASWRASELAVRPTLTNAGFRPTAVGHDCPLAGISTSPEPRYTRARSPTAGAARHETR